MSFNKNQCAKALNVLQSCMKVSILFHVRYRLQLFCWLEQHNLPSFCAWGIPTKQPKIFGYSKANERIYFPDRAYCLQVPPPPQIQKLYSCPFLISLFSHACSIVEKPNGDIVATFAGGVITDVYHYLHKITYSVFFPPPPSSTKARCIFPTGWDMVFHPG